MFVANAAVETLSFVPIMPELLLGLGAIALLLYGALVGEARASRLVSDFAMALMLMIMLLILFDSNETRTAFYGAFVDDPFARFMKLLSLGGSLISLLLAREFFSRRHQAVFELPILMLLSTLGMMMLVSASDLIALYVGLELMSLALYVLAAINRDSAKASEAGLKYFVLGALSSGMLLYGASLLYGFSGAVSFQAISAALTAHHGPQDNAHLGAIIGLVFVLSGVAFKISAVPFHMWTPDVYEGAPTPITAFFASAPKVAAMALFLRLVSVAFPHITADWRQIVIFLSIASMALGAFAAIGQKNFKRLMAYSSIGHMGFALVGLAAGTQAGVQGVMVYMAIYLTMTLGAFAAILGMRHNGHQVETITDLSGLSQKDPLGAFFIAMLMFSLAGIPPLAGFFAKFQVFTAAVEAGLYGLAITGVLLSVVSSFYYLRIVKVMYFDAPEMVLDRRSGVTQTVLGASALFSLLYATLPAPLTLAALSAAKSLF